MTKIEELKTALEAATPGTTDRFIDDIHRVPSPPGLEETIERMKSEILKDMGTCDVPYSVKSFSELHDHADANCYGGFCDEAVSDTLIASFGGCNDAEGMPQGMLDYINAAQGAIDSWLKSK